MHHGDCIAQPCSCMRCHAEELYNITSSVTWHCKSKGNRLYSKYKNQSDSSRLVNWFKSLL